MGDTNIPISLTKSPKKSPKKEINSFMGTDLFKDGDKDKTV
jgi:hypothetical protein